MSSFLVRRVSQHTLPTNNQVQKSQQKLTIRPQKITFNAKDEILRQNVVKLTLTNSFNYRVQFQIKQPKEPLFSVKCSKTQIGGGESIQLFLFNNFNHYICNITDQIIISTQVVNLFVSIEIINCQIARKTGRTLKKQRKTKQNLQSISKLPSSNHLTNATQTRNIKDLRTRKDGLMIINRDHRERIDLMLAHDKDQESSLNNRILKFNQQYERIHLFLKDKVIKNEIYLGERQISREKINEIISFNLSTQLITRELMQQNIISRYQCNNTKDGPSIRVFENIRLQWNRSKNQPIITYKKGLEKLFRQVRNIVIYYRFRKMNKILSIYRSMRGQQNIQQPQTKIISKLQYQLQNQNQQQSFIWTQNKENSNQDRQYQMEIQQKKKHDYYCRKINKMISNKKQRNLGADFNQFTLAPRLLSVDYTEPQGRKSHYFQIKPRIGFDNWISLEQSSIYNHELMGYTKMERLPQWECYPRFQDKNKSSGNNHRKHERYQSHLQQEMSFSGITSLNQNLFKIDKKQQITAKQAQKSLKSEFKICAYEQNYMIYKNYVESQYEIDCLNLEQINNMQMDIKKPKRTSFSAICEVKHNKQQYLPYFEKPCGSLIQKANSYRNCRQQQLIYSVKRDDIIDFSDPSDLILSKLEYIEKMEESNKSIFKKMKSILSCYQSNNSISQCIISQKDVCIKRTQKYNKKDRNNSLQKGQDRQWPLVDCNNKSEQNDQIVYEKILENLKLSQIRKYGIANGRILSYNGFIKNKKKKIHY